MEKNERDHLEKRLLEERERVIKALRLLDEKQAPLDDDGELTNYPLHLADEGTDTWSRRELYYCSAEGRSDRHDEALRALYKNPIARQCGNAVTRSYERSRQVPWAPVRRVPRTRRKVCTQCQRGLSRLSFWIRSKPSINPKPEAGVSAMRANCDLPLWR